MASFNPRPLSISGFLFRICAPITLSNVEGCGKFSAFEIFFNREFGLPANHGSAMFRSNR